MPVQEQAVIEGWRGLMVTMGLATPSKRALTAVLASGAVAYAMKYPRSSFRTDGSMRDKSFLLTPLAVGAAVYLFT